MWFILNRGVSMVGVTLWVIPTYNREAEAEALATLIESCDTHFSSVIYTRSVGWSLARAWNHGLYLAMKNGADRVVLINDDIEIDRDFPQWMNEAVDANPGCLVCLEGFSIAGAHPSTFAKVGKFDEMYSPAYYEDIDYRRRCLGAGVPVLDMNHAGVKHVRSSTLASMTDNERVAHLEAIKLGSQQHYAEKWGGLPGQETVAADAYNGQDLFL